MASLQEVAARVNWLLANGKSGEEKCHFGLVGEEVKKRAENAPDKEGKRATRIVWESGDPDVYGEFHRIREIYMQVCGENPTLATMLMSLVLRLHPEAELTNFMNVLEPPKGAANASS